MNSYPLDDDGNTGTVYEGSDYFYLESDGPVKVLIDAAPLSNGTYSIESEYTIDGFRGFYSTPGAGIHSAEHQLLVRAQLGRVSEQAQGQYSTIVGVLFLVAFLKILCLFTNLIFTYYIPECIVSLVKPQF